MLKFETYCEEETKTIGRVIGRIINANAVVMLSGVMGSGKTIFTKGIAEGLGINDLITSPTYSLVNEYEGRLKLFHFDIYRINEPEELCEIGFEEYLYSENAVLVIEWPERMNYLTPNEYIQVKINSDKINTRCITVTTKGSKYNYVKEELIKYEGTCN